MRRAIGLTVLAALAPAGAGAVRWAAEAGQPVGGERACAGAVVPLRQTLAATGLDLPAGAEDVHHLAREDPATGRVSLSLVLHTTHPAMTDYLTAHGIPVDRPGRLDDPRYSHVDAGMELGLCDDPLRTPAVLLPLALPLPTGGGAGAELDDGDAIRANTTVMLHASTG
ncbi:MULTISPECIES: hypothetical protein [Kitasatospora]|uniref:Uncharacterized protein n=1 Tax=Kitasatospora setae (strain ATCC 33774 / DSM 43861 / JCM 3304 / KCC A-0304 / NBRC 14216 / KM-6054) TaxID=452652 RepID=E4N4W3_KITSK|nr:MULTISPECIES: hypothetical protein [Kitasatospora]BAJ26244.1 hypothetical protein KSE_03970 [Kitasatospora setae KM-6054]